MRVPGKLMLCAISVATVVAWLSTASTGAADQLIGCGSVITEDTVLTHDVFDCENGLVIVAPNVTVDLGGHNVVGQGANIGVGISLEAAAIVVRNGTIRGFGVGVRSVEGSDSTVSDMDLASNGSGIAGLLAGGVHIENNTIHDNGFGIGLSRMGRSEIINNRVLGNAGGGILVHVGGGALVNGNLVMTNGGAGIRFIRSSGTALDNAISNNSGDGLLIDESCGPFLNFYRVGSNVANGNGNLGIDVSSGCLGFEPPYELLDAGGNAAARNGDPRQCTIHVACARNRGLATKLAPFSPTPIRPDEELPAELAYVLGDLS